MPTQPPTQDLVTIVDFTAINPVQQSDLNAALVGLTGHGITYNSGGHFCTSAVGGCLVTTDSAVGVPVVPDATTQTKWRFGYTWIRVPYATDVNTSGTLYVWNDNLAISDPTYQKWVTTKFDPTSILAAIAALQTQTTTALNAANTANTNAANALTQANAAVTAANTASSSATIANAAATAANIAATTALNTATGAQTTAAAANSTATNAQTVANTANNNATNALGQLAARRHIKFSAVGVYKITIPVGVTSMLVKCWGAGGSSSTGTFVGAVGCGGGGGEYTEKTIINPSGIEYAITIGAGGTSPGAAPIGAGTDGATSKVTTTADLVTILASAIGGSKGNLVGGAGGAGGVSDLRASGFNGGTNGYGGASPYGAAGGFATAVANGTNAQSPGGGGGGGLTNGGNGGDGQIEIWFT